MCTQFHVGNCVLNRRTIVNTESLWYLALVMTGNPHRCLPLDHAANKLGVERASGILMLDARSYLRNILLSLFLRKHFLLELRELLVNLNGFSLSHDTPSRLLSLSLMPFLNLWWEFCTHRSLSRLRLGWHAMWLIIMKMIGALQTLVKVLRLLGDCLDLLTWAHPCNALLRYEFRKMLIFGQGWRDFSWGSDFLRSELELVVTIRWHSWGTW